MTNLQKLRFANLLLFGFILCLSSTMHTAHAADDTRDHDVDQFMPSVSYNSRHDEPAKDDAQAARQYKRAADRGDAAAEANLGVLYEMGWGGLPKDDIHAARLYKLAADQGNALGQARLGVFYTHGRGGLPKNETEAARLYKLAADQGNAYGQVNLGWFYERGLGGLPKDEVQAARLYKLAADQGLALGQSNLGTFYARGLGGLPKDELQAARLYKLAADQGNAPGQIELGRFYENGLGGLPRDDAKAAKLYKLAADQGNDYGASRLRELYARGRGGVTKDFQATQLIAMQLGAHMQECWTYHFSAPDSDKSIVRIRITTDEAGVTRIAEIDPKDAARMSDPQFRSFAESAQRAILDPRCANLGKLLPASMLGQRHVFVVRFGP